ncbi:hypothetical protein AA313_de0205487 [Arthrobotrys entomopaga]|nr:hypothetical protein AA313_de0205487 [Arthrobotrys entomopaga]
MDPDRPAIEVKKPLQSQLFRLLVLLVTLPYHRFFLYNNLRPVEIIEKFAPYGTENGSPDREKICGLLKNWRARKKGELDFISIAGVAITAIVTATLSWAAVEQSHWVGIACFYSSLIMSIIGMLLSAQQVTLLTLLGEFPDDWRRVKKKFIEGYLNQLLTEEKNHNLSDQIVREIPRSERRYIVHRWRLSWQMIFVWQIPMMAVGYGFLFYIIGLSALVLTPLFRDGWGDDAKVNIL